MCLKKLMARCNENLALLFVEFGREEYLISFFTFAPHYEAFKNTTLAL